MPDVVIKDEGQPWLACSVVRAPAHEPKCQGQVPGLQVPSPAAVGASAGDNRLLCLPPSLPLYLGINGNNILGSGLTKNKKKERKEKREKRQRDLEFQQCFE